eukprot:s2986_g14.t1
MSEFQAKAKADHVLEMEPRFLGLFEVDDPVKYTLWRELFINSITFCDPKYGELIRDVEALDIVEPIGTMEPNIRELGIKLYRSSAPTFVDQPTMQQ